MLRRLTISCPRLKVMGPDEDHFENVFEVTLKNIKK